MKKGRAIFSHPSGMAAAHLSMGAAVLPTLWAYDGWINVGFMAVEMKNQAKTLPKAIITGIMFVMAAYLGVNAALFHVLPGKEIVALGPNTAAGILFGGIGAKLITVGILISIFGCLNGKLMTFPRITFAMAESGMLPGAKWVSWVHPKYKTPVGATLLVVFLSVLLMIVWNPYWLSNISIFSVFSFYGLAFFCAKQIRTTGGTYIKFHFIR